MNTMDPDLVLLVVLFVATIALIAFGTWKAASPHNSAHPRLIPWKALTLLLAVAAFVLLLNIVTQLGFNLPGRGSMSP